MKKIVSTILIIILLIYLNYWIKYGESSNTVEYIIALISIFMLVLFIFYHLIKFIKDKN